MSFMHSLRILARKAGIEVTRYNPLHSQSARLIQMISSHDIDVVIDVGANDGGYGRDLRGGGFKGDILSFEPLEGPYNKLSQLAALDPRWEIAPRMAIGSKDGEIEINIAGNSTSSSIMPMLDSHKNACPESEYVGSQKVPILKLDSFEHDFLSSDKNILLKIDTQGFESEVLAGVNNKIEYIRGIQVELSLVPLYEGQLLYKELIDQLLDIGFVLWNVVPGFTDVRTGQMLQMDGVFFRR